MHKYAPRESCAQRLHRLEDELHQLSTSLKRRKRKPRSTTPPPVDTLKPFELAARSLRAQQNAARRLIDEKGGAFVDGMKSQGHLPDGMESDEESIDLWETLTWASSPRAEGKTELPTNEYRDSVENMLGRFVSSNDLIREEEQTAIVGVSKDDNELPLRNTCTQDSATRKKKRRRKKKKHTRTNKTRFCSRFYDQDKNQNSIDSFAETVVISNIAEMSQRSYHQHI